jgi:hypothetical protein
LPLSPQLLFLFVVQFTVFFHATANSLPIDEIFREGTSEPQVEVQTIGEKRRKIEERGAAMWFLS